MYSNLEKIYWYLSRHNKEREREKAIAMKFEEILRIKDLFDHMDIEVEALRKNSSFLMNSKQTSRYVSQLSLRF